MAAMPLSQGRSAMLGALVVLASVLAPWMHPAGAEGGCSSPPANLLGGEIVALPMDCRQHAPPQSLDESAHANHASFVGNPPQAQGRWFDGYRVQGEDPGAYFLRAPDDPSFDVTAGFGFSLWAKPEVIHNRWHGLFSRHGAPDVNPNAACGDEGNCAGIHLQFHPNHPSLGDPLVFSFNFGAPWSQNRHLWSRMDGNLTVGQWSHLAGSLEQVGSDVRARFWVNGQLLESVFGGSNLSRMNTNAPFSIGRHDHYGPGGFLEGGEGFEGVLDEVLFFDRAITPADVARLRAASITSTAPGAPQGFVAAQGDAPGELDLSWAAPASNGGAAVTEYRIYRGEASGNLSLLTTTTTTSYTDAGLPNGATRHYQVSAVNAVGEGPRSTEASATTATEPTAPQAFTAAQGDEAGEIDLAWTAPANDGGLPVTTYRIYRGEASGNLSLLTTTTTTTYTDTGLPNGATRHYQVSAVNAVGEGPRSTEASATTARPPSEPLRLVAEPHGGVEEVLLTWEAPASNGGLPVTSYKVYRGISSDAGGMTHIATVTDTTHVDLPPEFRAWWYRVTAVNGAGEGPHSNAACSLGGDIDLTPTHQVNYWMSVGCVEIASS